MGLKKLIFNSFIYTFGNILVQGINFITLPIFTELLPPEEFGKVIIYTTYLTIFSIIISMQSNSSIVNAKYKYSTDEIQLYLNSLIVFKLIIFFIALLLISLQKHLFENLIGLEYKVINLMVINAFFYSGFLYLNSLYIHFEKPKYKILVSLLYVILNIGVSLLLIKNNKLGYMGRIYGNLIATVIVGGFFYIKYFKISKIRLCKKSYVIYALGISVPLIFHNISHIILNNSDKIMLEKLEGIKEVGLYSISYSCAAIINIIGSSSNSAWVPWLYKKIKNKEWEIINQYEKLYLDIYTVVYILYIIVIIQIFPRLFSDDYIIAKKFIPLLALGNYFIFLYTFSINLEIYFEKTKYAAVGTLISAIINIILNYILIKKYGILGATFSTLISYIFLFVFHEIGSNFIKKKKIKKMLEVLKRILLAGGVTVIYTNYKIDYKINIFMLTVVLFYIFLIIYFTIKRNRITLNKNII